MDNSIHLTVATVIQRNNKYLLVRERINGREVINQPAGHVEPHERLVDAALRETREETGFDASVVGMVGLSTYHAESSGITFHRVTFLAELVSAEQVCELDPDILGIVWMTLQEIEACNNLRSPMVLRDIQLSASGQLFPLEILWENSTMPASS